MTTFWTSDPHFGHVRIIDLCGRPFDSVTEMNDTIVSNFNERATEDDRIMLLGDACMGKLDESLKMIDAIRAKVVLVVGNHDRPSLAMQRKGNRAEKIGREAARYMQHFSGIVLDSQVYTHAVGGFEFAVSHYPYTGDHGDQDRYPELRPKDRGRPLLHGHVHELWKTNGRMFNVGVDVNDFQLVTEEEILDWRASL